MDYGFPFAANNQETAYTNPDMLFGHMKYVKCAPNQLLTHDQAIASIVSYFYQTITAPEQWEYQSQSDSADLLYIRQMLSAMQQKAPYNDIPPGRPHHKEYERRVIKNKTRVRAIDSPLSQGDYPVSGWQRYEPRTRNVDSPELEETRHLSANVAIKGRTWSEKESALLRRAVAEVCPLKWALVAEFINTRNLGCVPKTASQCRQRWVRVEEPSTKKGRWSKKEDSYLIEAVLACPPHNWSMISAYMSGRVDIQVRKRLQRLGKKLLETGVLTKEYLPSGPW